MDVATEVPLAPLTTLGVGGPARRLVTAYDDTEVVAAVRDADGPVLVLGGGSNVLLPDEGWDGTVVRVATKGVDLDETTPGRVTVTAAAGECWDGLVLRCVEAGLAGLEALSGIPGLVGASPIQNVGAYGQEVSQTCTEVRVYDRRTDEVRSLPAVDCGFAYRSSRFKRDPGRWVILGVGFELVVSATGGPVRYAELARELQVAVGASAPARQVRSCVLSIRRRKGMVIDEADPDSRSAGSFFTNPLLDEQQLAAFRARLPEGLEAPAHPAPGGLTKVSAAWLVEQAGFHRGWGAGPAGISSKHALALVNRGGARSADLLAVARAVRDGVRERFGVELVPEPVLVDTAL